VTAVLIANRGEIACRIIRSCRVLGLETVAVFSEADAEARHVKLADTAVPVGPPPVRESYLDINAILAAAKSTGAALVHPGYGLLSENAGFAQAVADAGLFWVGPAPATITAMADKAAARTIASAAGVPVLPGTDRLDPKDEAAMRIAAEEIGYPVLVKASGGGGGIGMRSVENAEGLAKTVKAVSDLAARTFGDGGVFLERHVARARHVEIQVFGLGDGRVTHLHDRDCSVQRRFQKVIEEAPAPGLSDATRAAMAEAACRLAESQSYAGAGTVEFILDAETEAFFFLEMNTRIQVEHPVTEMVTGADLVALQLRLALGEDLSAECAAPPPLAGHAVECRLYAENPAKRFLPSPGPLERFRLPDEDAGLRIDTGFTEGDVITTFYDPMIAKIITHGADRDAALTRMSAALGEVEVVGIATNLEFLRKAVTHPEFAAGDMDTRFIDRHGVDLTG